MWLLGKVQEERPLAKSTRRNCPGAPGIGTVPVPSAQGGSGWDSVPVSSCLAQESHDHIVQRQRSSCRTRACVPVLAAYPGSVRKGFGTKSQELCLQQPLERSELLRSSNQAGAKVGG